MRRLKSSGLTRRAGLGVLAATTGCAAWLLPAAPASATQGRVSPPLAAVVSVSPTTAQTVQGIGASAAWWTIDLSHFPRSQQLALAKLLFSPAGIDLSGYRYNIGGGGVGVSNPSRAPQSFLVRPGVYDWSADAAGVGFLELAARYRVPVITGFANSAPAAWTTDAKSCAGSLSPGSVTAYARYLAEVVRNLRGRDGVTISYVSPMNEPDNSFSSCGQEGMSVPVTERASLIEALSRALGRLAPWARVISDESATGSIQLVSEAPQWLEQGTTAERLAAVAYHGYDYPTDSMLASVQALGNSVGKALWMTETCCYDGAGPLIGFGQQYDPTMTSGIWLADTIWQDFAVAGDSAFYWWTAASSQLGCDPLRHARCATSFNAQGWNDGLVYYDPDFRADGNYDLYPVKRLWVLGNFSRYVRPGAVVHPTTGAPSGIRSLAFSQGRSWSVVLIDDQPAGSPAVPVAVDLPSDARLTGGAVTGPHSNLAPARSARQTGPASALARLGPQSVTTLTFAR